jgi:hypothetical protein
MGGDTYNGYECVEADPYSDARPDGDDNWTGGFAPAGSIA